MGIRIGLALAAALAVLAAPASAAEQKRHSVAGEGVSLSVPNSWLAVSGRDVLSPAVLDEISRENPQLAPFLRALSQSGSVLKFVAFDPNLRSGFATNVNLISVRIPGKLTFEQYQQAMLAGLQTLKPLGAVAQSVARIDGRQALRVSYRFRLTAAGRTFTVQTLQYAFLYRGKSLVFTFTTLPRFKSAYAGAFAASASSIRFR